MRYTFSYGVFKILTTLFLAFFFVEASLSQDNRVNNLVDSLNNASDTNRVNLFIDLTIELRGVDNDKSLDFANKAVTEADNIDFKRGLADALFYRATVHYFMSDYPNSKIDLAASLALKIELNDWMGQADIYVMQGIIADSHSRFDEAITLYYKALDIYEKLNRDDGKSVVYSNLATDLLRQKKPYEALALQEKSLEIDFKTGNAERIAVSYSSIAYCWEEIGDTQKSLEYYKLAEQKYLEENSVHGLSMVYNNIGVIYRRQNELQTAMDYFYRSLELKRKLKHQYGIANSLNNIGLVYLYQGKYSNANDFFSQALQISKDIGSIEMETEIVLNLSLNYEKLKDYEKALNYQKIYKQLSDSIFNQESQKKILELQGYFENQQKEKTIEDLNKSNQIIKSRLRLQNLIIVLITLSALFGIGLTVLFYNRYKLKKKSNELLFTQNIEINEQKQEILSQNEQLEIQAKKLTELSQLKSDFFTNISHEFRTPLTLIIGPVQQMLEKCDITELQHNYNLILRNASRLLNLINQLLDISKLEKGNDMLNLSNSDFCIHLRTLIASFDSYAKERQIELIFENNCTNAIFYFDIEKTEKIFINLLSNAFKFTTNGGKIKISVSNNGDFVKVNVQDTGIGIPKEKLPHIFDRFFQVQTIRNNKFGGSGIGLALTKELIDLHQGKILVESTEGYGSVFSVLLPLNLDTSKSKIITAQFVSDESNKVMPFVDFHNHDKKNETQHSVSNQHVLMVEDNLDMLNFIVDNLKVEFQVSQAQNGEEGLNIANDLNPDIIISDIMMPVMDGLELTRKIKSCTSTSHIPVILLTAKSSEENIIEGLESLADDYITKPFVMKELILKIKNQLQTRQKLREKFEKVITVAPSEITTTSLDEQLLQKALQIVENHIADTEFDVNMFCSEMAMSRTNLHRKLKGIVNQSATEFIRSIRLKRAAYLLKQKSGTISEIAYQVGFENLSYFTKSFREHFGCTPSEFE